MHRATARLVITLRLDTPHPQRRQRSPLTSIAPAAPLSPATDALQEDDTPADASPDDEATRIVNERRNRRYPPDWKNWSAEEQAIWTDWNRASRETYAAQKALYVAVPDGFQPLVDRYDEAYVDERGLLLDLITARLQRIFPAQAATLAAVLDVTLDWCVPLTYGPGGVVE